VTPEQRTRGIDIVVYLAGLVVVLEGLAMMRAQKSFAAMIADFGHRVPPLTRVFLEPWVPLAITVPLVLIGWEGALRKRGETAMSVRAGLLLLVAIGAPILFLTAMYQPMWQLGAGIK